MLKKEISFISSVFLFAAVLHITKTEARVGDLESYEPTTLGYTQDSDDDRFLDFKISVKYPLFPTLTDKRVFFAFSGRFGQYLGTRSSSPVIGKRFNPKLCMMFPSDTTHPRRDYIDLAYGHESNGQKIDTLAELNEISKGEKQPSHARDYISRGWDYLEIVVKNTYLINNRNKWASYFTLNYYLPHGLLQGKSEEYNTWENDSEGKRRESVNGLRALFKYDFDDADTKKLVAELKVALMLETGYHDAFANWTTRGEFAFKVLKLPILFWASHGYNSDLALYYKKVTSYGIAIEIGGF